MAAAPPPPLSEEAQYELLRLRKDIEAKHVGINAPDALAETTYLYYAEVLRVFPGVSLEQARKLRNSVFPQCTRPKEDSTHICTGTCTYVSLPKGKVYVNPQNHFRYRASGDIFLCKLSSQRHLCTPSDCVRIRPDGRQGGNVSCPISGRSFAPILCSYTGYGTRDIETQIAEQFNEAMDSIESSAAGVSPKVYKQQQQARRRRAKRPSESSLPASKRTHDRHVAQRAEIQKLVHTICDGSCIRASTVRSLERSIELAKRAALESDGSGLALVSAASCILTPGIMSAMRVLASQLLPPVSEARMDYYVNCIIDMQQHIRDVATDCADARIYIGRDPNLQGTALEALYCLRDGIVCERKKDLLTSRYHSTRALTIAQYRAEHPSDDGEEPADPTADEDGATTVLAEEEGVEISAFVIVPRHEELENYLPEYTLLLKRHMPELAEYSESWMKRNRSVQQRYLAAIGLCADPRPYCITKKD